MLHILRTPYCTTKTLKNNALRIKPDDSPKSLPSGDDSVAHDDDAAGGLKPWFQEEGC